MTPIKFCFLARSGTPFVFACALVLSAMQLRAQYTSIELDPQVTTATRVPEFANTLGTQVDSIQQSDLARRQLSTVADALSGIPGAPIGSTGQIGAVTSVFLRGSNSNQTLFLVDGIPLNDSNTDYSVFLAGAKLAPGDTIEIAQGPQSTLYGGEAVGGVVSLMTARGMGPMSGSISADAGSFGSLQGAASLQGVKDSWGYNVSASTYTTNNERINNRFAGTSVALRLDKILFTDLSVGLTVRGLMDRYGDPSDIYTNDRYAYETEHNWLSTLFLDGQLTQYINTHLILGMQDRNYNAYQPRPGSATLNTVVQNRREILDWQFTGEITSSNKLTAGLTADLEHTKNTGFGAVDKKQTLRAYFVEDEAMLIENVYLTAGARQDTYDTFGTANTERITLAILTNNRLLKFRGSYGTGFDAPSFLDLYGKDPYFVGNPKLLPEKTKGWDFGFDFYFPNNSGSLTATWFNNDYTNLIIDNFMLSPATTANVEHAKTDGLEFAAKTIFLGSIKTRAAYTYMQAINVTQNSLLLRRPEHSATIDLWEDIGSGVSLGLGASFVGQRSDVSALNYATIIDRNYTIFRLYSNWNMTKRFALHARIENLLNRKYSPVNGYPALGLGFYAGVDWKF